MALIVYIITSAVSEWQRALNDGTNSEAIPNKLPQERPKKKKKKVIKIAKHDFFQKIQKLGWSWEIILNEKDVGC